MHEEKVLTHYRLTEKKKRIKGNENKFGLGLISRVW